MHRILWFPVVISALSVPQAADDLGRLIEDNWAVLEQGCLARGTQSISETSANSKT